MHYKLIRCNQTPIIVVVFAQDQISIPLKKRNNFVFCVFFLLNTFLYKKSFLESLNKT